MKNDGVVVNKSSFHVDEYGNGTISMDYKQYLDFKNKQIIFKLRTKKGYRLVHYNDVKSEIYLYGYYNRNGEKKYTPRKYKAETRGYPFCSFMVCEI